ncbi:MAG TPA: acetate--CoA ligase family protein [Pseudonocardia sp.]|jgi:acyl-CoA synthetase (NDP forming)|nr:acetate--CoA ligase family protein [Pseudonocardia sp.]
MSDSVVAQFLDARDVVLVGASDGQRDQHSFNARMTRSLLATVPGSLHLVNPSGGELDGRVVHPSVTDLPTGAAQLAVVVVPGSALAGTLRACREREIRSALVITGNLSADERLGLEAEVAAGIRVWGPNCVGFSNAATGLRAIAGDPAARRPGDSERTKRPSFAVVGQSGGALANISLLLARERIRMRYFLSTGEEVDVGTEDCLDYLLEDPDLDGCFAFIETPRHPHRFRAAARRLAASGRPLVVVKVGRTRRSRAVAMNHTGAIVGAWEEFAAACTADGAIVCSSWEEAADVCSLVARWRGRRVGPRVAVFTSSGATGALACDLAEDHRLDMAELGASARDELLARARTDSPSVNPYDSTDAGGTGRALGPYLDAVRADPNTDLITLLHVGGVYAEHITETLINATADLPPTAVAWGGVATLPGQTRKRLLDAGIPVYEDPARLYRALGHLLRAAKPDPFSLVPTAPPAPQGTDQTLSYAESLDVLARLEIRRPASARVSTPTEAREVLARGELTLPVVAKSADVRGHKVAQGGVRLGLHAEDQVAQAVAELLEAGDSVVLEEQLDGGVDLLVGARLTDFGRMLLVGAGAELAELPGQSTALMEPVALADLVEAVAGLPIASTLDESLVGEAAAVCDRLLTAIGTDISEIEINPLRAVRGGLYALDAKVATVTR